MAALRSCRASRKCEGQDSSSSGRARIRLGKLRLICQARRMPFPCLSPDLLAQALHRSFGRRGRACKIFRRRRSAAAEARATRCRSLPGRSLHPRVKPQEGSAFTSQPPRHEMFFLRDMGQDRLSSGFLSGMSSTRRQECCCQTAECPTSIPANAVESAEHSTESQAERHPCSRW